MPTPVGPRKRKLPSGRAGSASPVLARRIARATAETASSWPMTRRRSAASRERSLCASPALTEETGMPVQLETTSAIPAASSSRRPAICAAAAASSSNRPALSGRAAAGYIAAREAYRGAQGVLRYGEAVVPLERREQGGEHIHAGALVRLRDVYRLEAPLERRVLFYMPPVFLRRRRAYYLHLAAGQRRLEYVRRVHRAVGRSGADYRVQLVDEQYDVASALYLAQDAFYPVLEVAAVLCAGEEGGHVERDYALALQLPGRLA